MQEKITALITQFSYEYVEVGLYTNNSCYAKKSIHKYQVTAQLIPTIQAILTEQNLTFNDITYIGANTGPGPYNTLRGMLATCNGLHASLENIPLVETTTFNVLRSTYADKNLLILFDAYSQHLYYATHTKQGYCHVSDIAHQLLESTEPYYIVGNAFEKIKKLHPQQNFEIHTIDRACTFSHLDEVARMCTITYKQNETTTHLEPLYLKHAVKSEKVQSLK